MIERARARWRSHISRRQNSTIDCRENRTNRWTSHDDGSCARPDVAFLSWRRKIPLSGRSGDFWLAIKESPMPKPVDRELPRWQQKPDFIGDRSRFVAISDTRYTS